MITRQRLKRTSGEELSPRAEQFVSKKIREIRLKMTEFVRGSYSQMVAIGLYSFKFIEKSGLDNIRDLLRKENTGNINISYLYARIGHIFADKLQGYKCELSSH